MRGRDPDTGEFLDDSRSHKRREALSILALADRLMESIPATLAALPLPEELHALVLDSQRITSNIARKRQKQFLAKALRREDDPTLDAIRAALEHAKADARRDTAALHRVEHWRLRLMDGGDTALAELLAQHPDADRQRLRQLARNAHQERLANKPPHAFRELFHELRALLDSPDDTGSDAAPDAR